MWQDLAYSFRTLRRSPMFSGVAVLSLALGIGANTAIFSLLDQVVLRSLPVRDPERLVVLHREFQPNGSSSSDDSESVFSVPMYRDLRDRDPAFAGVVARMSAGVRVEWQGNTEAGRAEVVSGNFFTTLGVGAAAGRTLLPSDDGAPGAHPVTVLGYGYWVSRFAGNRSLVGRKVAINGLPFTVVGVADAGFHGLVQGDAPAVFVPIAMQRTIMPTVDVLEDRSFRWLNLFARLKPGETVAQAQAATAVVYHRIVEAEAAGAGYPQSSRERTEFLNHNVNLRPASQGISALREKWENPLRVLMVMVGLVLLIACANVAGLLLARATGRRREISIRLAMGAPRSALVKLLLLEGFLLSLAGGALGLVVERWSTAALLGVLPSDAFGHWIAPRLDANLFLFTFALAAVSGFVFALVPALEATRTDLAASLRTQAANLGGPGGPARLRQALVTAQVALSMLLAVGAGLFARSAANLLNANLGFRPQHLMLFNVNAALDRPDLPAATAFYRALTDRLKGIPGVVGVAAANSGLFGGGESAANITVEGYHARENEYTGSDLVAVSPGFFHALGIPLRAGRDLSERDESAAGEKAIVVNETFVKRYFAGQDPIRKRLVLGGSRHPVFDREIVGVAANSRSDGRAPLKETIYFPYAHWKKPDRLEFFVRSAGDQGALAAAIRQAVRETDPDLPVSDIQTAQISIRESHYAERLIAMLALAFGILATLLAAIGLYGVMAYAVARRTNEIGVRMALGARPASVLGMMLWEAGRLAVAGIVIGWIAAFALGRFVESQLFGVTAGNPAIYAAVTAVLAAAALAAALIPGWRAARIDPLLALKYE